MFQLIENRRGNQTCETYLVSQQTESGLCGSSLLSQPQPRPLASSGSRSLMGMKTQASIDLGMLHQARSQLQPVWRPQERSSESNKEQLGEEELREEEDVERFIAVPISATEQYLISSTGQTYLTEKLPSPLSSFPIRHQMSLGNQNDEDIHE